MKKFIDRKQELEVLNKSFEDLDSLILISGPHHVGKTQLIKEFIQDKPAFYFSASEFSDELNRKNFLELLQENFPNAPDGIKTVPSWDNLLTFLGSQTQNNKSILVIDNLDNIIQADPNFPQTLDKVWKQVLKPQHLTTILALPNNSVLNDFNQHNNNLKKDLNLRLQLKPIPFFEMLHYYPNKPLHELVSIYNITGGFPLYWDFFIDSKSIMDHINKAVALMAEPNGFLYDLPLTLLQKNVWDTPNYATILYYIANGVDNYYDLLKLTKLKKNQLLKYLSNLEILGYVKALPSILKRRQTYKNSQYVIANPLFKFWFRYIYPNRSKINQQDLKVKIIETYPEYVEETFKSIAKELFLTTANQELIDFDIDSIGSLKKDNLEIPILAIDNKNKQLFIADTQFSLKDYDIENFLNFMVATLDLPEFRKYKNYKRLYGLFTANTPSEELMRYAVMNDDAIIFSGTKLIK